MAGWEIHIEGCVQGVGFRPWVYRLATGLGLCGRVSNGTDGLRIQLHASRAAAERMLTSLRENPPPAAIITGASLRQMPVPPYSDFAIAESPLTGQPKLLLTPDLGLCQDCREEIEGDSRRKDYAFTTCTNCGPRYSITAALPYDRPRTTMAAFSMCPSCLGEYHDPTNRRHFSQTNSCPDCAVELQILGQEMHYTAAQVLEAIVAAWRAGKMVAIKGIGGFLLTCDATNAQAIQTLRERKHRPDKPLAIMVNGANEVANFFSPQQCESEALTGTEAPIVLLRPKVNTSLAIAGISPGLDRVGVMLPYTPLFQLLLDAFDRPIVATSGNISGEPIVYQDAAAATQFADLADLIIGNNRPILVPQDDSVLAFSERRKVPVFFRRSRGYAPTYLPAIAALENKNILAFGSDLKATFGLQQNGNTYLSQYLGDLSSYTAQLHFQRSLDHLHAVLQARPQAVIADLHPDFSSTQLAETFAAEHQLPLHRVQHHEAHFAAVLLDNGRLASREPILGVVWDGTGYGHDGNIWGGEFFRYSQGNFQREGHFGYFPHFSSDKLAREPRLAALAIGGNIQGMEQYLRPKFTVSEWQVYQKLRAGSQLKSSSVGRLFDAVACLLGVADLQSYEGMAASRLEVLARRGLRENPSVAAYQLRLGKDNQIATAAFLEAILVDRASLAVKAYRFHLSLVRVVRQMAVAARVRQIAFSGGVFQNTLLVDLLVQELGTDFELHFHQRVSPNDEGIALGQLAHYTATRVYQQRKKEEHVLSNSW